MRIIVQKEQIRENYRLLKEKVGVPVIPVLKANGYGLGAEGLFELLKEDAPLVAVSRLEEALPLCGRGVELLVLSCYGSEDFARIALEKELTVAVGDLEFAKLLSSLAEKPVRVHIKVDTGMGRFGFMPRQIDEMAEVFALPNIEVTGIFSHLSAAFLRDGSAEAQLARFNGAVTALQERGIEIPMRHLANTGAALREDFALDAVRIGSALTGRSPVRLDLPLQRVGRVEAEVLSVRTLPAGSNLGYGNVCRLKKETTVAVVAAGTADGFAPGERHDLYRFADICRYLFHDLKLFLKKPVVYGSVGEQRAPMLGRPATTHSFFDVTGLTCKPGDKMVLDAAPLKVNAAVERIYE